MLFYYTSKVSFNKIEPLLTDEPLVYFCNLCYEVVPIDIEITKKQSRALKYLFFKQIMQNDIGFWLNNKYSLPKWSFIHTKDRQRNMVLIPEKVTVPNSTNSEVKKQRQKRNVIKNAEQLQASVIFSDCPTPAIEAKHHKTNNPKQANIDKQYINTHVNNVIDEMFNDVVKSKKDSVKTTNKPTSSPNLPVLKENHDVQKLKEAVSTWTVLTVYDILPPSPTEVKKNLQQPTPPPPPVNVPINIPVNVPVYHQWETNNLSPPPPPPQPQIDLEFIDALNMGFDDPLVNVEALYQPQNVEPPIVFNNPASGNFIQTYIDVPFMYDFETYIYDGTFTNFHLNPQTQIWEYIQYPPYLSQIDYNTGLIDLNINPNNPPMMYEPINPTMIEPSINQQVFIDPMYMPMEQIVYNDDPMFNANPYMFDSLMYDNSNYYDPIPNDMIMNNEYFFPYTHLTPSTMIIERHIPYFMNTSTMNVPNFSPVNETSKPQLEDMFNYTPNPRQPLLVEPGDEVNFGEIEIDNLSYCYPGNNELSLNRCTFRIKCGEFHVFAGENGAGKSTFIKCLFGMEEGYEGVISINRRNILDNPKLKGMLAYVADIATFPSYFTTYQYLYHIGTLSGVTPATLKQKILLLLKQFQIPEVKNKNPNSLSMGQKKKVLLIRSLLERAKVLVLDEPAANLDPTTKIQIFDILKKLQVHGITIFISTHLLDDIKRYATNLTLISKGKILHSGDVSSVEFEAIARSFFSERSKGIDADDVISNVLE